MIPSAIQLFAWITTILTGTPDFKTPLLFIVGFIVMFIIGGLSGITVAAIPFDQQVEDSYYIVAHFHFVIFGAAVFPILGGMYYWFPKVTGPDVPRGRWQAQLLDDVRRDFVTFFPMHIVGILGMPRRVYTYPAGAGLDAANLLETIGAYLLAAGLLLIVANLGATACAGVPRPATTRGEATRSSGRPPRRRRPTTIAVIPTVTSPYPMWDAKDRERDNGRLRARRGSALARRTRRPPRPSRTPSSTRSCRCPRVAVAAARRARADRDVRDARPRHSLDRRLLPGPAA